MPNAGWRVLIADDEPAARRGVCRFLEAFADFRIVGECRDGDEVLQALDALQPHVVFLDVQMPGADAFEVIRRRTLERMPAVVFLTAYEEYAIGAFDVQALDYLLKPVTEERFAATMRRVTQHLETGSVRQARFVINTPSGVTVVPLREVDWIEAADSYARLWIGRRSYLIRRSLRDLQGDLSAHGFARVHRRALVCLDRVHKVTSCRGGQLMAILASGAEIEVSRRQRTTFLCALRSSVSRPR